MEIPIIIGLVVMLVSTFVYCYRVCKDNGNLRKELMDYRYKEWVREYKSKYRKEIKIINPQLGDQSVLDTKIGRLMKEGYTLYEEGCVSGMLVFAKNVKVEEEEKK